MSEYHVPVLLTPSLEGLAINPDGYYVDATFGGGGHAKAIASKLSDKGHLFVFDQDESAASNLWESDQVTLVRSNFRYLHSWMKYYDVAGKIDGILADLGVSSHQFDEPERGFSYRFDELLDMRMNRVQPLTAADILRDYSESELVEVFSTYGELPASKSLAREIVNVRKTRAIKTTGQLVAIAEPFAKGLKVRYLSQLFQALRIAVNDEMGALQGLLTGSRDSLKKGGRLVVISYHSLEDRMVKRFLKSGNIQGDAEADWFGNVAKTWKVLTNHPIEADENEMKENPRSRSAKLRIGEKL